MRDSGLLLRDAPMCTVRYCHRMLSVCLSVRLSVVDGLWSYRMGRPIGKISLGSSLLGAPTSAV